MHPSASSFVVGGIAAISLLVAVMLVVGYARATRSRGLTFAAGVVGWLGLLAVLALSGILRRWELRPPPMVGVLVVGAALAVIAARGAIGTAMARELPLAALIGFHAFRVPLELVMHQAAIEGTMPVQMSFSGNNFDIVSGVSAIVVALLVARGLAPRWLVLGWTVMSTLLLVVIVSIAIASMPMFAAFGRQPDRLATWVAFFPFVWLPGLLVPAALFGQLVVFRRLAETAPERAAA